MVSLLLEIAKDTTGSGQFTFPFGSNGVRGGLPESHQLGLTEILFKIKYTTVVDMFLNYDFKAPSSSPIHSRAPMLSTLNT